MSPSDVTLLSFMGVSCARGRWLSCQLCLGALFSGSDDALTHSFVEVASSDRIRRGAERTLVLRLLCKFVVYCILADRNAGRDVHRAAIPYAPLYPTFEDRLNRFRQAEASDLRLRGAEQIVDNAEIYGSQRSSEDASIDLVVPRPEDIPSPGPPDTVMLTRPQGTFLRETFDVLPDTELAVLGDTVCLRSVEDAPLLLQSAFLGCRLMGHLAHPLLLYLFHTNFNKSKNVIKTEKWFSKSTE